MIRADGRTARVTARELIPDRRKGGITRFVGESITSDSVPLRVERVEPPRRVELRLE